MTDGSTPEWSITKQSARPQVMVLHLGDDRGRVTITARRLAGGKWTVAHSIATPASRSYTVDGDDSHVRDVAESKAKAWLLDVQRIIGDALSGIR